MVRGELPEVAETVCGLKDAERNQADKVIYRLVEDLGCFAGELEFNLRATGSYGEVYKERGGLDL